MSDILSIGASGVRAYQTALTTTSENIANAGATGYSRRTTNLSEVAAISGRAVRSLDGNGVTVKSINRLSDDLRTADVRAAGADLARTDTSITYLGQIETALSGNQLSSQLTSFFNAASAIAADPTATAARSAFLEQATAVANAFAGTGRALDQININLDVTADDGVRQLETLGNALAKLNSALGGAAPGSATQAQLFDQRDQLLEQLSALSDIAVTTDARGRASVKLGGVNGPLLVEGQNVSDITYVRAPTGAVSFAAHRDGATSAFTPGGGALAGIVDGAQRVASALQTLDQLATDFVDGVNTVQAGGRDLDGNAGAPLFAAAAVPTEFTVVLSNPRGVAAAAVGGGPRDNTNLDVLAALRTSAGFEGSLSALVADNAAALASRRTVSAAQTAIRDGAVVARDAISGVNLDSEAVDLLRFQQAYQASSRVIQVARETLQTILDIR
ncbi:MAG: flagellar hook-associated protein FlgK [Sphingomonas sp.]|jgi:flagellar hook-associated protein 1 FlgK